MVQGKKAGKVLYLSILDAIRNGSAQEAARVLGFSKQQLSPYLKTLKMLGVVEKRGYGVWVVNESNTAKLDDFCVEKRPKQVKRFSKINPIESEERRGIDKIFTSFSGSVTDEVVQRETRAHAFEFVLKVRKLQNWTREARRAYLADKKYDFKSIQQGERVVINDCKVWLTNKSVIVWLPHSFFVRDAQTGYSYAVYEFERIISRVESMLAVSLRIGGKYLFRVCKQEYALVNNALAKQYNKDRKKLYVWDQRDGFWAWVDDSGGSMDGQTGEFETGSIPGKRGVEAANSVQRMFNSVKQTKMDMHDILRLFQEQGGVVQGMLSSQQEYAENIKTHITAIQTLAEQQKIQSALQGRLVHAIEKLEKKLG